MPRISAVVAVAVVTWTSVAAAEDLPEIKARGSLRVLVGETEQPEMFSLEADGAPGFERELLQGFARLHGLEMEIVPVKERSERIPSLLRGDGDMLIGLVDTPARRARIDFTHEVLPAPHVVVTWVPHRIVESLDQLREEQLGILAGASWAHKVIEAGVPEANTRTYPDLESCVDALEAGRVSATVMSVSNYVLVERRRPGLQMGMIIGETGSTAWGVRKPDDQLQAALDEHIDNVRRTLSWSHLVVRYFGEQALDVLGRAHGQ